MALNFPNSPIDGQTFTSGTTTWTYNATVGGWKITSSGPTGYTGSAGYIGSQGVTGYDGSRGSLGYTGSQGDIGYTGSLGATGYVGSQGATGFVGSKGDIGYTGSKGDTGYAGSKGDTGYVGSTGPTGGANTEVLFNDQGTANGSTNFTFNKNTNELVLNGSLNITGNIYFSNVMTIVSNNIITSDNMFYLNSGSVNNDPDLGFAGNYNDGIYRHAGFFRDATDGVWKVYDSYLPEPDASIYIDTANTSFRIADFQSNTLYTRAISANGSVGTAGQVLASDGSTVYWSTNPGYTGSKGDTGSQGTTGYTGSKGDIGVEGVQGETGYTGSQGDLGYTGSKGDLGYTGSWGGTAGANVNMNGYSISNAVVNTSLTIVSPGSNGTTLTSETSIAHWVYDNKSFSVTTQESGPEAVVFSSNGSIMFTVGWGSQKITQYALGTPWDVSTASFTQQSATVGDTSPGGMWFKPDGTKAYIVAQTGVTIREFNLSTAWDVSTLSFVQAYSVAQDTSPEGVSFSTDGTKMYILGNTNDRIYQYTLGTAWNVSTATYDSKSLLLSVSAPTQTNNWGMFIDPNGFDVYVVNGGSERAYQYTLGTQWDISTGTIKGSSATFYPRVELTGTAIWVESGQNKAYLVGVMNDTVYQYTTNIAGLTIRNPASSIQAIANVDVMGTLSVENSASITGPVSIQTSSTTLDALRITQEGTGNAIRIEDSTTNDTSPFIITTDGRVSHGSSSPWLDTWFALRGAITTNITNIWGFSFNVTLPSNATGTAYNYNSFPSTTAASYTLSNLVHFNAGGVTLGAGSTVTTQYGHVTSTSFNNATTNYSFYVDNVSGITSGRTHYGYYSAANIATGGGTSWNLYMAGTAPNYINGNLGLANTAPAHKLSVNGTTFLGGLTTFAANTAYNNNFIANPTFLGYTETEIANTATTGTYTMDCTASNFWELTLTGNTTISPSNVPANGRVWTGTIAAKQDAVGGRTIAWPSGTKYAGGIAPPPTTAANALDLWSLMTYDGGSSWIVSLSVKDAK